MPVTAPSQSEVPKITYPGFTLNDETAEKFVEDYPMKLGAEFSATVRLKVTSLRQDQYGNSIGFDVFSMDGIKGNKTGWSEKFDEQVAE